MEGRLRFVVPFYLTLPVVPLTLLWPELWTGGGGYGISENLRILQLNEAFGLPWDVYLFTQFRVIITYIRLLLLPTNQHFIYDYPHSHSLFEAETALSFLILLSLLGLSVYFFKTSRQSGNFYGFLFSFGIFWFFITLSVESSIIPIKDVISEQRVYLPGVGFIIAITSALFYFLELFKGRFRAGISTTLATCLFLLIICPPLFTALYKRNQVWTDELLFLTDAIEKTPGWARLYQSRGIVYFQKGRYQDALSDFDRAISLDPAFEDAYNNRGFTYHTTKNYAYAVEDFTKAISLEPDYAQAYFNRGLSYAALGRYYKAIEDFTTVIALQDDNSEAYNNRGVVYTLTGKNEKALSILHTCV
jgi:tetratricopeptide (TPR) repeat protein